MLKYILICLVIYYVTRFLLFKLLPAIQFVQQIRKQATVMQEHFQQQQQHAYSGKTASVGGVDILSNGNSHENASSQRQQQGDYIEYEEVS